MASASNTAAQAKVTKAGSSASWPYRAKRRVSTAEENGFTAHTQYSQTLDSCIFHSGYSAVDKKNTGNTTKFITPAKFSIWFTHDEINIPAAPNSTPVINSAGNTQTKPIHGRSTPHSWAISKKPYTCTTDTTTPASSRQVSSQDSRCGLVSSTRMLTITR